MPPFRGARRTKNTMNTDVLLFALGTAALAWLSRKPLRAPGSHGFYRFFVWEGILFLLVLNRETWGSGSVAPNALASWVLMLSSILMVSLGLLTLRFKGAVDAQRDEGGAGLYEFEKTTTLVTTGVFGYIRHPMYTSLLLLTWGVYCQLPSLTGLVAGLVTTCLLVPTVRADERECAAYFGESAYDDYRRRTKMFIPFVF